MVSQDTIRNQDQRAAKFCSLSTNRHENFNIAAWTITDEKQKSFTSILSKPQLVLQCISTWVYAPSLSLSGQTYVRVWYTLMVKNDKESLKKDQYCPQSAETLCKYWKDKNNRTNMYNEVIDCQLYLWQNLIPYLQGYQKMTCWIGVWKELHKIRMRQQMGYWVKIPQNKVLWSQNSYA